MERNKVQAAKPISGVVISHKTPKTAVVSVSTVKVHPKYHKRYTTVKKYVAHDPNDEFLVGDKVEIIPSRPYSRTKRFIITGKIS